MDKLVPLTAGRDNSSKFTEKMNGSNCPNSDPLSYTQHEQRADVALIRVRIRAIWTLSFPLIMFPNNPAWGNKESLPRPWGNSAASVPPGARQGGNAATST